MQHRLTDIEKLEVVEKYKTGKYTCAALGKEYGIRGDSISSLLQRRNIIINHKGVHQRYTIDENFFDKIDTEQKAYFLGFLYADGCNYPPRHLIRLSLQEQDEEILKTLNNIICSNRPLQFCNIKKNNKNCQNAKVLNITNKHMSQQLAKLGCVSRKSLILEFPTEDQVPPHLVRHFIRGYFDGDGCLTYSCAKKYPKYRKYNISIISTEKFCIECQNIINYHLKIEPNKLGQRHKNRQTSTRYFKIGGKNSLVFLDWLYKDSKIYLKRKHNKYIEAKQYYSKLN